MSFVDDLIDLNDYQNNDTYDINEENESKLKNSFSNGDLWSNGKYDSPNLDSRHWQNEFNTEQSGMTKLVSSEEDIVSDSGSSSPEYINGHHGKSPTQEELCTDYQENMDLSDGFASHDVLTIGEFPFEEEHRGISVEGHTMQSMAEQWSNTEYETVLRTNYVNIQKNSFINPSKPIISKNKTPLHSNMKSELCCVCNERVYATEQLVVNKRLFHHLCFKCTKCHGQLRMSNFGIFCDLPFCMPHYLEVFNQKGKYDVLDGAVLDGLYRHPSQTTYQEPDSDKQNEMPPPEITKTLLEIFRQLECSNDAEQGKTRRSIHKARRNFPCPGTPHTTPVSKEENTAHYSLDDMPTPGMTKTLLQHWNSISNGQREDHADIAGVENLKKDNILNYTPHVLESAQDLTDSITATDDLTYESSSKSYVHIYEGIGTYAQISCPTPFISIMENDLARLEPQEIFQSSSTKIDQSDELPEEGITRNLVEFFQTLKDN